MTFISEIAKSIAGYMGGSVLEGPQEGKTAHQITSMLSGAMRSTGKAPSKTSLPKQKAIEVEMTPATWRNQAKIFPNSPIVRQEAEKERVANINLIHRQAGRKKMGRETTDPAQLAALSGGPPPAPVARKREKTDNKLVGVLGQLAAVLPAPIKGAVMAAGVAIAAVKFPLMLKEASRARLAEQSELGKYSGRIARTMALMQVQDVHLGLRTARTTSSGIESLGKSTRRLGDTLQPYEAAGTNLRNAINDATNNMVSTMVRFGEFFMSGGHPDALGRDAAARRKGPGLPFQEFLQTMNPPVAQARNERVAVREAVHRRGA